MCLSNILPSYSSSYIHHHIFQLQFAIDNSITPLQTTHFHLPITVSFPFHEIQIKSPAPPLIGCYHFEVDGEPNPSILNIVPLPSILLLQLMRDTNSQLRLTKLTTNYIIRFGGSEQGAIFSYSLLLFVCGNNEAVVLGRWRCLMFIQHPSIASSTTNNSHDGGGGFRGKIASME